MGYKLEREDLLTYIERMPDIKKLCDFIDDEVFDIAQGVMIKCIYRPDVPQAQLADVLTQLSSVAGNLQTRSKAYKTVWKSEPDAKAKYELYHSTYYALNELVASMKYQARQGN